MLKAKRSGSILASRVEHFRTASDRSRGLLKYKNAPESYAAVFHLPFAGFCPIVHTFGMKFSIHIAFCDAQQVVRAIYSEVLPNRVVIPWRYLLGGVRFLVETSRPDRVPQVGDELEWSLPT